MDEFVSWNAGSRRFAGQIDERRRRERARGCGSGLRKAGLYCLPRTKFFWLRRLRVPYAGGANGFMLTESEQGVTKRRLRHVFSMALALAAGVFFFHTSVLYEVANHLIAADAWLTVKYGTATAGKAIVLVSFFVLFITHVIEAAAWGLFLWRKRLIPTFSEGVYFCTTSITGLGYGDVLLPRPWRLLGPLVAISGILMFGCSTAFLFLVIQKVWVQGF